MSRKVLADLALKLSANSAELKRGIEESRRQMGSLQRTTADVGKNVAAQFAKMAVAVAAVKKAFDIAESTIKSTQTTGDALAKTMGGMKEATLQLQQAIAAGDFSNFINNMREAYQAGREYIAVLDELADRSRAVDIGGAQAKYELVRLRGIASNTGLSDNQRLGAAKEMERIALAQLEREKDVKQGLINAELNLLQKRFDLTDQQLALLRQYTSEYDLLGDGLLQDAYKAMDAYMQIGAKPMEFKTVQGSYGSSIIPNVAYDEELRQWNERKKQATQYYDLLSREQQAYVNLMKQMGGSNMNLYTDEMRDALAKAEKDLWNIMTEFQMFLNQSGRYEGQILGKQARSASGDGKITATDVFDPEFYYDALMPLINGDPFDMNIRIKAHIDTSQGDPFDPDFYYDALQPLIGGDPYDMGLDKLNTQLEESMKMFDMWASVGSSASSMIATSIVDMAMGAEQSIEDVIKQLLRMVGIQILSSILMNIFAPGSGMLMGGMMGAGMMGGGMNIPQMASGGIAYGPSIVQVGEYPGARLDPEIISRASDLRNILGFDSGGMNVTVRGKLDGEDMYISNERFLTRKNLVE